MTCLAYHKKSLYPTTFKQHRYKLKKQLPIDIAGYPIPLHSQCPTDGIAEHGGESLYFIKLPVVPHLEVDILGGFCLVDPYHGMITHLDV